MFFQDAMTPDEDDILLEEKPDLKEEAHLEDDAEVEAETQAEWEEDLEEDEDEDPVEEILDVDTLLTPDTEEEEEGEDEQELPGRMASAMSAMPSVLPKDSDTISVSADRASAAPEIAVDTDEDAPAKKEKKLRKRWYIVNTYSGHENKVKVNLERRIESMNMGEKIFRVEVPQKTVTKIKDGRRSEKDERIFPGYVLVEMLMDDDSWYVVRHTPGVTKFVGSQKKPIPAKDSEIKRILLKTAPVAEKVEIDLKVGDIVSIISGPFAEFEGTVTEVSPEKERLKASVSIFGRETPVELAFNQVQKAT
ncbi:MAG: transcription termination/antitermination protein NusG [Candidatus Melainabacteria bacterium]